MTDITKLPDKWRKNAVDGSEVKVISNEIYVTNILANELEAALPVWTKITDNPNSWPEVEAEVALEDIGWIVWPDLYGTYKVYHTLHWRPLCDLDYPPEYKE